MLSKCVFAFSLVAGQSQGFLFGQEQETAGIGNRGPIPLGLPGIEVVKRRAINWPPRRVRIRRDLRTFPRRYDRRRLSCPGCVPRRQAVDPRRYLLA